MTGRASTAGRQRILVVDDTSANLQLLCDLFTSHGYTVHPASDGELALRFVQLTLPDLILLDIRMPGLDGFEVCRRLKADPRTRDIPVIFISMLEDERDKVKGFQAGGVDYVTKPFQPEEVLARVGTHLRLRDLTQHLETEIAESRRVAEALRETVTELENLSYTASHDLRAPLRAVHGFSQLLREKIGPSLSPDALRYVVIIQENVARMGLLLDSLLAFLHLGRQPLRKETVAPGELIAPLLEELRTGATAIRHVEVTVQPLPRCNADPALVRQVFANLLDNAFKYTRPRSEARITVGSAPAEVQGEVVYFVRDNGIGFDPRYAGKLFRVFHRLHRAEDFEGVGAGLAIVQRIVQRHGGRVWSESQLGKGATFYFSLEAAAAPQPQLAAAEEARGAR